MGNTVQCAKACSLPEYMISVPKENGSENSMASKILGRTHSQIKEPPSDIYVNVYIYSKCQNQ